MWSSRPMPPGWPRSDGGRISSFTMTLPRFDPASEGGSGGPATRLVPTLTRATAPVAPLVSRVRTQRTSGPALLVSGRTGRTGGASGLRVVRLEVGDGDAGQGGRVVHGRRRDGRHGLLRLVAGL